MNVEKLRKNVIDFSIFIQQKSVIYQAGKEHMIYMEWQYISSKSNALVVRLAKLKDKKYRKEEGLFRFDGIKLFSEAVAKGVSIRYVLLKESASAKYKEQIEASCPCDKLYVLSDDAFSKLTDEQSPEGVITVCDELSNVIKTDDYGLVAKNACGKTVMMLESVRDAGNLGTIIRSAGAFGIDYLIISSDCADLYNPKTVRAAMGALFSQQIVALDDITKAVRALRDCGSRVFAAALNKDAQRLGDIELKLGDAILIGNEGHGLSQEVIDACNSALYIPMEEGSESLNASIAASVCMWELYKTK